MGVVHTAVGSRVDLHYIQGRLTAPNARATLARSTRLAVVASRRAVQGHGEHACERRLADPPGPAKQVGMADAVGPNSPLERLGDVLLRGHVGEGTRAVLAC